MRKQQYAPLLMAPMIARQRAQQQQQQVGDMGRGRGRTGVRARGGGRPGGMLDHEGMPPYHHGAYPHPQHSNAGMGPAAGMGPGVGVMGAAGGPGHSSMGLGPGRPAPGAGGPGGLPSFQSSAGGGGGMGGGGLGPRLLEQQHHQQQLMHAAGGGGVGGGHSWSDEDFVECYRQHGRNWEAYCRVLGVRTESAAKQYYYRHKDRLGLDRVQVAWQAAGGPVEEAEGEGGGQGAVPVPQAPPPVRRAYLPAKGSMEDVSAALGPGPLGGRGGGYAQERPAASSEPPEAASPGMAGEEGQGAVEHKDGMLVGALDAEHPVQQLLQMPAKGPGRGRRSARTPIGNAAVVGSVLLHASALETTETLRQEGAPPVVLGHRTVVKTESGMAAGEHEGDLRSDSEFDAAAAAAAVTGAAPAVVKVAGTGGGGAAAGEHAAGHRELSTLIDLSAALASSGAGSALSHLLSSAGLQLHAPAEGGPDGATGAGGAKGIKGGELQGGVAGGPEGHLAGLGLQRVSLGHTVGAHGQQQGQDGRGELDRAWEREQQGGAGRGNGNALAGLNLGNVLGGLLHGAGGGGAGGAAGGGSTGATINLFTGE